MAIQETTPPRNIMIGYKELAALAVTILVIAGAIMGAMQWAVATAVTPLREEIRREMTTLRGEITTLRGEMSGIRGEITTLRGEMSEIRGEMSEIRGELTGLRKDISDLSNRVTRIETILEQQRPRIMMAPDTP